MLRALSCLDFLFADLGYTSLLLGAELEDLESTMLNVSHGHGQLFWEK